MNGAQSSDSISLKPLLYRLWARWYIIVAGILIASFLGFRFLASAPNLYEIEASILLDDPTTDNLRSDQFMKEIGLFVPEAKQQDEISILSSFNMIKKTVRELPIGIEYRRKKFLGTELVFRDLPFSIELDSSHYQVVQLPIEIKQIEESSFHVKLKGENVSVYDLRTNTLVDEIPKVDINQVVGAGEELETPLIRFTIHKNAASLRDSLAGTANTIDPATYLATIYDLETLTKTYYAKLSVIPKGEEAQSVTLYTTGADINQEISFMNKLLEVYIKHENDKKAQLGKDILAFIDIQAAAMADSLRIAEDLLEAFRSSSKLVDISTTSKRLTEDLLELEDERSRLESRLEQYELILETLQTKRAENKPYIAPSVINIDDPLLKSLLQQLSELYQERVQMEYKFQPGNPKLEEHNLKIDNVLGALVENTNGIIKTGEISKNKLEERIDEIRKKTNRLPSNEKELVKLQRQFELLNENYRYLLKKRAETNLALANNSSDNYVFDYARLSSDKPVAPNKLFVYLGIILGGLGIPIGLILTLEMFNDKLMSLKDIEQNTRVPLKGLVVSKDIDTNLLTLQHADSILAECFRSIRVAIRDSVLDNSNQVIGITSTWSGEGKTFCAANLSSIFAQAGKKTLIVDLDLRRPRMMEYHEYDNIKGLSTYLKGQNTVEQIIKPTKIVNLDLLPSGPSQFNSLDLIEDPKFAALIETLKKDYDKIILDTPPIGQTSDYIVIKELVDYTVFILRHKRTQIQSLAQVNELYDSGKIKNIGLVMNDVQKEAAYGFGDKAYGYGKKLTY